MSRDLFCVANLCRVTHSESVIHTDGCEYKRYCYEDVDKKIFYYKNKQYIDIDTNKSYTTSYEDVGNHFVNVNSIIPFEQFLKENRIIVTNDNLTKKRVKEIYNYYKS